MGASSIKNDRSDSNPFSENRVATGNNPPSKETGRFDRLKSNLKWRVASLSLRNKFIIIIGVLLIGMLYILSFTFIQNGKRELTERLSQTCEMSLQHVSKSIKDDILLFYKNQNDANARSAPLGAIREAILGVYNEGIDGLEYAQVVDRSGTILAHTRNELLNTQISAEDSLYYATHKSKTIRVDGDIIEHIHPIYARRAVGDTVYLGVATLGFSKNIIMAPVRRATRTILYATLFITVVSVILIFFVARRMTRQIEELGEGVRRISGGRLDQEIPVYSNDELGRLAREFNTMLRHLREKNYMQKFVSPYAVRMIRDRSNGHATLDGESHNVTLLFSDIRNFSNLTERLNAREIVNLINIYLDVQSQIIEIHEGVVDKYMGDQVMAIFEGERQADNAVKAAVDIQRAIHSLNKKRSAQGLITLQVGIGINAGQAVMGNMGSKNRMDYTVIGDVVNLASRLCAIAQPGQIIAPLSLSAQLKDDYPKIQLNPVWVKGRSKPISTFEVDYEHVYIM